MIQVNDNDVQALIESVYKYNQGHIFHFWESLDDEQKENLLEQISWIDFPLLSQLIEQALSGAKKKQDVKLEPPDVITLEDRKKNDKEAKQVGIEALEQGKVAAFLVAGGQGTRLGFDGPKGMYPVTPVKKKSLFQLHAEKLLAIGRAHGGEIPWYIMTSLTNNQQTIKFFEENKFFGYESDNIFFFIQEMIPAINRQGKLILDQPDHIFMNPNGHGGSIKALSESGALVDMSEKGVDYIFYFQVDNVLTYICDPVYIGYHMLAESEMSSKVVKKKYPEEKMGVLCKMEKSLGLVEYSDMDEADMKARNSDGSLKLWAGNIATHLFDRAFLEKENEGGFKLPYHLAEKSIPYIDHSGKLVKPDEKNGVKFETFVFDALIDAKQTVCLEVERKKEFSPLKNKEGENSPETVRKALFDTYTSWLESVGHKIPRDDYGNPTIPIEISPLAALIQEDLKDRDINWRDIKGELYID